MKIGHILLNMALIVTAIVVYDVLRRDPSRSTASLPPVEVDRQTAREPAPAEPEPALAGVGREELLERIEAVEQRLALLAQGAPRTTPSAPSDGTATARGVPSPAASPDGAPPGAPVALPDVGDPKNPRIDPQTLEWFRAHMDEVDRIRERERRYTQEKTRLARAGVSLTPAQEQAVIEATLRHREREQERGRSMIGRQGVTREEQQAAQAELRAEYVRELEKVVSSGEAEQIADGMIRPRGFSRVGRAGNDPRGGGR